MGIDGTKKYINTIKHLSLEQISYQIVRRIYKRKIMIRDVSPVRRRVGFNEFVFLNKNAFVDEECFDILNTKVSCQLPYFWNHPVKDNLLQYNIHYFDFLLNPKVSNDIKNKYINVWIKNTPIDSLGYDAYPTSLRIVSWFKWTLISNTGDKVFLNSLYSQCQFLFRNIEYHISGNHIIANVKALLMSGMFFEGKTVKKWYERSKILLKRELSKQILVNGGHCELSPMYHNIVLEDLLDIVCFHRVYHLKSALSLEEKIVRMLDWSHAMTHPDGEVSFFNDSVRGVANTVHALEKYAINCGIKYKKKQLIECDGYYAIKKKKYYLIFDAAEIGANSQPGHAHADSLSFELSVGKKRVFVNSGVSTYHDLELREKQRSTASHSTLSINTNNSSQVWNKFRVANRAKIFGRTSRVNDDQFYLEASHDGYTALPGCPKHKRSISGNSNTILIRDMVDSYSENNMDVFFYVHPDILLKKENDMIILMTGSIEIEIKSTHRMEVIDSMYYPSFNQEVVNKCIRVKVEGVSNFENDFKIMIRS